MLPELLWIAEARKHIGQKEIPGPSHNPHILSWLKRLRAWWKEDETPWCFVGETEIMTAMGWQRLDSLTASEVYQVDPLGGLTLTKYLPVRKPYRGEILRIRSKTLNLACDPAHRWWGVWPGGEDLGVYTFGVLPSLQPQQSLAIPMGHSTAPGVPLTDDNLILLAAFISDGKYRCVRGQKEYPWSLEFEVSRDRKIQELTRLGPNHVYTQRKAYGPLTKTPLTVFRFETPKWFMGCFESYKRLTSTFINQLSRRQAQVFLRAYSLFDGNNKGDSASNTLYTSNQGLLGDLMIIAVLAGYHSSTRVRKDSSLGLTGGFTLTFCPVKQTRTLRAENITSEIFEGDLYCVSVPEGRIIVRGTTGAPVVVGNCGVYAAQVLSTCGLGLPKDWYRAKAYLELPVKLDRPAYGCIVIFEREGGGHVGFVVGRDQHDNLMVLGGNQGDMVCIRPFKRERASGYRWPSSYPAASRFILPLLDSDGKVSSNEA